MPRIHLSPLDPENPKPLYPKRTAIRFARYASALPDRSPHEKDDEPLNTIVLALFPQRRDMLRFIDRLPGWQPFSREALEQVQKEAKRGETRHEARVRKARSPEKRDYPDKVYTLSFRSAKMHRPVHPSRTGYRFSSKGRRIVFETYADGYALRRALERDESLTRFAVNELRARVEACLVVEN